MSEIRATHADGFNRRGRADILAGPATDTFVGVDRCDQHAWARLVGLARLHRNGLARTAAHAEAAPNAVCRLHAGFPDYEDMLFLGRQRSQSPGGTYIGTPRAVIPAIGCVKIEHRMEHIGDAELSGRRPEHLGRAVGHTKAATRAFLEEVAQRAAPRGHHGFQTLERTALGCNRLDALALT